MDYFAKLHWFCSLLVKGLACLFYSTIASAIVTILGFPLLVLYKIIPFRDILLGLYDFFRGTISQKKPLDLLVCSLVWALTTYFTKMCFAGLLGGWWWLATEVFGWLWEVPVQMLKGKGWGVDLPADGVETFSCAIAGWGSRECNPEDAGKAFLTLLATCWLVVSVIVMGGMTLDEVMRMRRVEYMQRVEFMRR